MEVEDEAKAFLVGADSHVFCDKQTAEDGEETEKSDIAEQTEQRVQRFDEKNPTENDVHRVGG